MAIDPICDMEVNERTAKWTSDYQGKRFYFCAPGCKKTFEKDPAKWANKPAGGGHEGHSCSCCGGH